VDLPPGYGSRRIVDDAFAHAGVSRRVLIEVADLSTAAAYVPQGLGLAIVPRFAALAASRVRDVRSPIPPRGCRCASCRSRTPCPRSRCRSHGRRRPLTAAAQGLVDLLRTELLPQPLQATEPSRSAEQDDSSSLNDP
jgi:DNA-binding transcriptional LysR family regulator